jgi:hypothetical protein
MILGTTEMRKMMMEFSYVKQSKSQNHITSLKSTAVFIKNYTRERLTSMRKSVSPQQEVRYCFNNLSMLYHTNYIRTILEHHHHYHHYHHAIKPTANRSQLSCSFSPSIALDKKRHGDAGEAVGRDDGGAVGRDDGRIVGRDDGGAVGRDDGRVVGRDDGGDVGRDVGRDDGTVEVLGSAVGASVGSLEGITVGSLEGLTVGVNVGLKEG